MNTKASSGNAVRRDWLLTGLSVLAAVMAFLAVDKIVEFQSAHLTDAVDVFRSMPL